MLDVEVFGAQSLYNRVHAMYERIDHFKRIDIGQTMSEWQTRDMNRGKPFTMRFRGKGWAQTKVRPHSLYEVKASQTYEKYLRKHHRPPRTWSTRPYLRDSLFNSLVSRVREAMTRCIHW